MRASFQKYDTESTGFVGANDLASLLEDTFKANGVTKVFTNEEVYEIYQSLDPAETGKVSLPIYKKIVLKALEKAEVKI